MGNHDLNRLSKRPNKVEIDRKKCNRRNNQKSYRIGNENKLTLELEKISKTKALIKTVVSSALAIQISENFELKINY